MPAACGSASVLTGQDGAIYFTPPATSVCLLDNTDFPAGSEIKVGSSTDYRIGDPVEFSLEGAAKLDTALTVGSTYYIVDKTATTVKVSASRGGTPIALNGDGGGGAAAGGVPSTIGAFAPGLPTAGGGYGVGPYTAVATTAISGSGTGLTVDVTVTTGNVTAIVLGTAVGTGYKVGDRVKVLGTALGAASPADDITLTVTAASAITGGDTTAAHINMMFAEALAVCQASDVQISFTRGEIDTTSLPCGIKASTSGVKLAGFRTYQPGYAEGSGSMTVRFTADNTSFANRLLQSALFANQSGAILKVYLNAVADATGLVPDDDASLLAEFPVSLLGFSFGVTPEDTPTEASLNFRLSAPPTKLLGLS